MLIIRQKQIEVFSQYRSKDFEKRAIRTLILLSEKLCRNHDENTIKLFVQKGITEARTLKILTEIDMIRYLRLKYQLMPQNWSASRFSWIHRYLQKQLPAGKRIDLIVERLRFDEELGVTL